MTPPSHTDDTARARAFRQQAAEIRRRAPEVANAAAKEARERALAAEEKKARAVERAAEAFEGKASFTKYEYTELENGSRAGKRGDMHLQAARVNMSRGKKKSSDLVIAANDVGHSLRSLSAAVGADPRIKGTGYGCTHAQLSAALRAKNPDPIRRVVTEVVRDLTKHGPIAADPSRGIVAKDAYEGFPTDAWKNVIEND
jgi:hypothetical protein